MIYYCAECSGSDETVILTLVKDFDTNTSVASFAGLCHTHYAELKRTDWNTEYIRMIYEERDSNRKHNRHCVSLNKKVGNDLEHEVTLEDTLFETSMGLPSNGRDYNMLREWYDERILAKMKLGYSELQIFVYLRDEEQTMLNRRDLAEAIEKLECYLTPEELRAMREIQIKAGRAREDISQDLIRELRLKGWGYKKITAELKNRGIETHVNTIVRRVKKIDAELLTEGIKITH